MLNFFKKRSSEALVKVQSSVPWKADTSLEVEELNWMPTEIQDIPISRLSRENDGHTGIKTRGLVSKGFNIIATANDRGQRCPTCPHCGAVLIWSIYPCLKPSRRRDIIHSLIPNSKKDPGWINTSFLYNTFRIS